MKSILEINVSIDAVILDAIKLASDKWNGIMAFAYEFYNNVATYRIIRRE